MSKIVAVSEYPPIPIRDHDWCAYYEGRAEGDLGWGPTEEAAINDLVSNYDAPDATPEPAKPEGEL